MDDVEEAQVGDQGALLQQQRQGLANASGGTAHSDTGIVLKFWTWVGGEDTAIIREGSCDYVKMCKMHLTCELVEKLLADLSTAPRATRLNMLWDFVGVVSRKRAASALVGVCPL